MEQKTCTSCKKSLPVSEYNWKNKSKNRRNSQCRTCTRKGVRSHYYRNKEVYLEKASKQREKIREENRIKVWDYLLQNPCVDCGEKDLRVLHFDHINDDKVGNISRLRFWQSWETLKQEIAKCEVVCANCHMKRTAARAAWPTPPTKISTKT